MLHYSSGAFQLSSFRTEGGESMATKKGDSRHRDRGKAIFKSGRSLILYDRRNDPPKKSRTSGLRGRDNKWTSGRDGPRGMSQKELIILEDSLKE